MAISRETQGDIPIMREKIKMRKNRGTSAYGVSTGGHVLSWTSTKAEAKDWLSRLTGRRAARTRAIVRTLNARKD